MITEAAHAARTHTVLEVFAYGLWHPCWWPFWEIKVAILFFCNKGRAYKTWWKDKDTGLL